VCAQDVFSVRSTPPCFSRASKTIRLVSFLSSRAALLDFRPYFVWDPQAALLFFFALETNAKLGTDDWLRFLSGYLLDLVGFEVALAVRSGREVPGADEALVGKYSLMGPHVVGQV